MINVRTVVSYASAKGRLGNQILHIWIIMYLLNPRLLIIDDSFGKSLRVLQKSGFLFGTDAKTWLIIIPMLSQVLSKIRSLTISFNSLIPIICFRKLKSNARLTPADQEPKVIVNAFLLKFISRSLLSKDIGDIIQKQRRLHPASSKILINKLTNANLHNVGIHIRLSDFKYWSGGYYLYTHDELADIHLVLDSISSLRSSSCEKQNIRILSDSPLELSSSVLYSSLLNVYKLVPGTTCELDWQYLNGCKDVLTNSSTFALSAWLFGSPSSRLWIPKRHYNIHIARKDLLYASLLYINETAQFVCLGKPILGDQHETLSGN